MLVYMTHRGIYIGPRTVEGSALPAGAVLTPPPDAPEGKVALWDGKAWSVGEAPPPLPIPPAVPTVVSPFQARVALMRAGLMAQVEAIMANPETDPETVAAWEYATEFRRDSPTLLALAGALGLSVEQVDELFRVAVGVVA